MFHNPNSGSSADQEVKRVNHLFDLKTLVVNHDCINLASNLIDLIMRVKPNVCISSKHKTAEYF